MSLIYITKQKRLYWIMSGFVETVLLMLSLLFVMPIKIFVSLFHKESWCNGQAMALLATYSINNVAKKIFQIVIRDLYILLRFPL